MQTSGAIKALIILCFGLLLGVIAYGVISGDAPGAPEHQEEEQQENDSMQTMTMEMDADTARMLDRIAEHYDMTESEVINLLIKKPISEEYQNVIFAQAWEKKVEEYEQ